MSRQWLKQSMPGLAKLLEYDRDWLPTDIKAGLSVAAVALPVAIAYSELVGVSPVVGLYSCILPMIAYALFGTSRQLIVGPDAATCAVIAAVVTPLALGDAELQWQLTIMMTIMTGFWCLIASRFRFAVIADLLSRPILNGLLNGVALTIIVDQISKVAGFKGSGEQLIERIIALPHDLLGCHLMTIAVSLLTLFLILLCKLLRPHWPSALITIVAISILCHLGSLSEHGVKLVGHLGMNLPIVQWPSFQPGLLRDLVIPAFNLALVSFISMILTARSFAAKNGYEINIDKEFKALGIINIVSGFSQGFAISGADSRTAMNDSIGGKSQLVSIIAALTIGCVLFFFNHILQYIPIPALGVILIYAAWGLLDFKGIWHLRKRDPSAFRLALLTFISVILIGILPGIGLAVLVGLVQFLATVFRPSEQLLGVNETGMIHSLGNSEEIKPIPGVMIYRFNSPLTYFNVAYFKQRILKLIDNMLDEPRWVVIDAVASFTHADMSVLAVIDELKRELYRRNISLVLAGRRTELTKWFKDTHMEKDILLVPDLYLAIKLIQSKETAQESHYVQLDATLDDSLCEDIE